MRVMPGARAMPVSVVREAARPAAVVPIGRHLERRGPRMLRARASGMAASTTTRMRAAPRRARRELSGAGGVTGPARGGRSSLAKICSWSGKPYVSWLLKMRRPSTSTKKKPLPAFHERRGDPVALLERVPQARRPRREVALLAVRDHDVHRSGVPAAGAQDSGSPRARRWRRRPPTRRAGGRTRDARPPKRS